MEMAWILIFHVPHNIHNVIAQRTDKQIKQEKNVTYTKIEQSKLASGFLQ